MKYRVLFTAYRVRKTPIFTHYRPDWTSDTKPDYNCAQLLFDDRPTIEPGETHECLLQPLNASLWGSVIVGDVLQCMEGSRAVGEASVLEIIEETRPKLVRDLSTPANREFWASAEQTAAEVRAWPEWKRTGIRVAATRSKPRKIK